MTEDPVVAHANYLSGLNNKKDALVKNGLWSILEDTETCI